MRTRGTRLPWRGPGSKRSRRGPHSATTSSRDPTRQCPLRTKSALHRAGTAELRTGFLIPFPPAAPLPIELQRELHGARIGLNIRNAPECAASLTDRVGFAIWARRQAVVGVRQPQVLVVERVEHL